MMITQGPVLLYPQPLAPAVPEPAADAAPTVAAEPAAKGSIRGLALLSGDAAAIVLSAQEVPARQDAASAALDLRGRDLREVDLTKLDLRGADLSGSDLSGKDLSGLDFTGAILTKATLDRTNLTDAKLDGVKAQGATFTAAKLLRTGLDGADLSDAKFNDAYISSMERDTVLDTLEQQRAGKYFSIKSVDFTNADFTGVDIRNGVFQNSKFDGAKFDDAKGRFGLSDSTAINSSFQRFGGGVSFQGGNISGADFSNIDGAYVSINSSKVDDISFSNSKLVLSISDTDVRKVDFSFKNKTFNNVYLQNVNMAGMNFSGYKFTNSNFSVEPSYSKRDISELKDSFKGTDFSGATFEGPVGFSGRSLDLNQANFDGARLSSAYFGGGPKIDKVKTITDALSAGKAMYDVPGLIPGGGASPDSSFRGFSTPEDRKIEDWLYSLMPPPDKSDRSDPSQPPNATATAATEHAKVKPFDMRKALTETGALDGAEVDGSPYSYLGDIFKNMRDADDAEPVRDDRMAPNGAARATSRLIAG